MSAQGPCPRCEILPENVPQGSSLHLQAPVWHTFGKMRHALHEAGIPFNTAQATITIRLDDTAPARLVDALHQTLSSVERADIQAVIEEPGQPQPLEHLFRTTNLERALARLQAHWLVDRLRNDELLTAFQPIFEAAPAGQANVLPLYGHECLLRFGEGPDAHPPGPTLELARNAGLQYQTDLAARRAALVHAQQLDVGRRLFINFLASSIYDPVHCLQSTVDTVHELGLEPGRIVFEVVECDRIEDTDHLKRILDYHRESGFEVALDDVGSGFSSLTRLDALRPEYIKLDRALIHNVHEDAFRATLTSKLLETAHTLGIRAIAEGVETEAEARWAIEHGADLLQGFYFARPAFTPWSGAPAA